VCDARGVIRGVTRDTLDDDAHSVERGIRLIRGERRTGPELVGAIVRDDRLAPAMLNEHAVLKCHFARFRFEALASSLTLLDAYLARADTAARLAQVSPT
jgi:hypothetical protein